MKNEKGITLIALIITIIVMLILVGVTITIVIQSGLFEQAKSASGGMQGEVERGELYSVAVGLYDVDSGINQTALAEKIANLGTEYTVDNERTVTNSKYVVSGPSGTIWQINLTTAEVKEYEEGNTSSIEYYTGTFLNFEILLALDYDNMIAKVYVKNSSDLYEFSSQGQFVLPDTFTVYFNEEEETELDGGHAYFNVHDNMITWYKRNGNGLLYLTTGNENSIREFDSDNYITLNNNFDTSLLVEPE